MFNLSSYLEKFKNLKDPKENKNVMVRIMADVADVSITEKDLSIQKGTVYIISTAFIKSRIFIKKEEILKKIQEELPNLRIKEII